MAEQDDGQDERQQQGLEAGTTGGRDSKSKWKKFVEVKNVGYYKLAPFGHAGRLLEGQQPIEQLSQQLRPKDRPKLPSDSSPPADVLLHFRVEPWRTQPS